MKKKKVSFKFAPLLKFIIIPIILTLLWIGLTLIQILWNDGAFTVVTRKYSAKEININNFKPILKGENSIFIFKAEYENLGYISINFDGGYKKQNDYLRLKIIDKDSHKVIKEADYFAGAFHGLNYYPFGFPIIANSEGKTYIVSIESLYGTKQSSVSIKKASTVFSASYQFDKSKFSNEEYLREYVFSKLLNSFKNNFLPYTSTIYALPFIFYLVWLFAEKHTKKKNLFNNPIIALLGISIVIDIFFVDVGFDLVFFIIPILWGGVLFYLKKESKESYKVALALLILCPILQLLGQDTMVEKAAAWAFLALTVGVIINLYELKKHPERFEDEN